jgi:hypothetical protein
VLCCMVGLSVGVLQLLQQRLVVQQQLVVCILGLSKRLLLALVPAGMCNKR